MILDLKAYASLTGKRTFKEYFFIFKCSFQLKFTENCGIWTFCSLIASCS